MKQVNPLQCYPPRHSSLLHLCFLNSRTYKEVSSMCATCATCLTHYILDFTSLTVGKFTNNDVPYYAVLFGLVCIPDMFLTTFNATPSIRVPSVG